MALNDNKRFCYYHFDYIGCVENYPRIYFLHTCCNSPKHDNTTWQMSGFRAILNL